MKLHYLTSIAGGLGGIVFHRLLGEAGAVSVSAAFRGGGLSSEPTDDTPESRRHRRRLVACCMDGVTGECHPDDSCNANPRECNKGGCKDKGAYSWVDGPAPSVSPSRAPTTAPSNAPTNPQPSRSPTRAPTISPTRTTPQPTTSPSSSPSKPPSHSPSTTPSVSPTKGPSKAPVSNAPKTSAKRGLIIGGQAAQASAEHFNDSVSWFYNYKQAPLGWQLEWARANNIEFVPMLSKDWLNNPDGSKRCKFVDDVDPPCTTQDAIDVIGDTISISGLTVTHVMGFNEMYNNGPPEDMTPAEAAGYWAKYVQPAAQAHGLVTVSPTLNAKPNAINWFSDFLRECDALENCDINLIDTFAIHQYDCRESLWRDWYGGDQSLLINQLKSNLGGSWSRYLKDRPLWITETNCYWEVLEIGDRYPHPDSKGQCDRTAGKFQSHGQGSIATMEELTEIERYSWWTLWNPQIKPNMLTYKAGQLTPAGRAYMHPGDTSVNCEYPGTKIYAESASLNGNAKLLQCAGAGGSVMITDLGKGGGTATFTVEVVGKGSHAVNVAFVTAATRSLSVSVNGGPAVQYEFVPSGEWCGNGGQSTVLPIEVDGFVDGTNVITFGDSSQNEPIIEWFSVVDESVLFV